jgi:hypothetical protein
MTRAASVRPLLPAYVLAHLRALAAAHGTTLDAIAEQLLAAAVDKR